MLNFMHATRVAGQRVPVMESAPQKSRTPVTVSATYQGRKPTLKIQNRSDGIRTTSRGTESGTTIYNLG